MTKPIKITYVVLIVLSAVLCVFFIVQGEYQSAVILSLVSIYSSVIYIYNVRIEYMDRLIDAQADDIRTMCDKISNTRNRLEEIKAEFIEYRDALKESEDRERIAKQELAKMRKRLEVTEAARKELELAYHNELQKNTQRATGIKHPSKV